MPKDLLQFLENHQNEFSKGQRAIAHYITEHYDKAAFMTAMKLGNAVGTSESTVVRFAYELGYDGYPNLQRELQELVRNRLTTTQRMAIIDDHSGYESIVSRVMSADADNIKASLSGLDIKVFSAAVEAILAAKNIYIIGVRSSSAPASLLAFYFNLMLPNVRLVTSNTASEVFEQILRVDSSDVIIGISFPRYSKRTVKAMQYARRQGACVVAVTDTATSPIAENADLCLMAKSEMVSFLDSLVAPLSIINALIVAVGMRKKTEVTHSFDQLEQIWEEYEVYEKNQ